MDRVTAYTDENVSPLGRVVAELLDREIGLHNIIPDIRGKVDWTCDYMIAIPWPQHFSLATIDGDRLTRLVVLTHDLMLRMEIIPRHYRWLELRFWQRTKRDGRLMERIPTTEDHVASIRSKSWTI